MEIIPYVNNEHSRTKCIGNSCDLMEHLRVIKEFKNKH